MFRFMSNKQYDAIAEIVDNQEKIIKQKEEEIIFLRSQVEFLRNILQGTSTGGDDYMTCKQNLGSIYGSVAGQDLDFPNSSASSKSSDNIFY